MPYRLLITAASRATGRLGWLRGALGALIGIALAGLATRLLLGSDPHGLWLVAPIGASSVLVFALPASPLGQPWAVAGGNLISAVIGLIAAHLVPIPALAAALAVGTAIAGMSLARCLHPPGGACALVGALAPPALSAHMGEGLLVPLSLNIALLIGAGYLYNNLTGHRWPHRILQPAPPARGEWVARYEPQDLDAVLDDWDEVLDVSRDDLDALFRAVERRVERRRNGG